jgi:hypothetical protein
MEMFAPGLMSEILPTAIHSGSLAFGLGVDDLGIKV